MNEYIEASRLENAANQRALEHNIQEKDINKLIPYENKAFLALVNHVDSFFKSVR